MLRIRDDGRLILKADGAPFFYLADTAWELLHRLNREEAARYLLTRAEQRFTVIQAVALAELDGLRAPNPYGDVPFEGIDPTRPNEAYWRHVDWIIERAATEGLVMGLLPTWGDKVNPAHPHAGPLIFDPENARVYGRFIGARYREHPIIWILGGDRRLETGTHLRVYRAMAEGIRDAGATQIMTFHPMGGSSSATFCHAEPWLDFNMLQSGHTGRDNPNWNMIDLDRARLPTKPVLDGEPNYEDHPVMLPGWKPSEDWFDAHDVRRQAWRALLAGACGHTYGCQAVWQMWAPPRNKINLVRKSWNESLDLPGANQMRHLRAFFESIEWATIVPDQSLLASENGTGAAHIRAARADDGSQGIVYLPQGGAVRLNLSALRQPLRARWFDPRTGAARDAGTLTTPQTDVTAPSTEDWVLHLTP